MRYEELRPEISVVSPAVTAAVGEAMAPSTSNLLQMIEQNDEKHEAAHKRLRRDLTDGFNDLSAEIEGLSKSQRQDHDLLLRSVNMKERRKELSAQQAIVLAAMVGGGFSLLEVLITQLVKLLQP